MQHPFSIQPFEAKRVRVESAHSFEEVRLRLRNLVGTTTIPQESPQELDVVPTREQFELAIQSQVGESDFTLMFAMDYGHWLPLFGIQRKVIFLQIRSLVPTILRVGWLHPRKLVYPI